MKLDMYLEVLKVMGLVAACSEGWWLTWDKANDDKTNFGFLRGVCCSKWLFHARAG